MSDRTVVGAWWFSILVVVGLEGLIFAHAMLKLHAGIDVALLPPLLVQQVVGGIALVAVIAVPLLGLRGKHR